MSEKRKIDLLSKKEKEFLLNYIELGKNGTKAYLKTYPTSNRNTAAVQASKLLRKHNVSEALQEYLNDIWEQKEEQISQLFDNLLGVANYDISQLIDEHGDVRVDEFDKINTFIIQQYDKSESESEKRYSKKVSIKLMDKLKATEMLVKILGMIQEKVSQSRS